MPSNFNKSVGTISAPANSATPYVDTTSTTAQILPSALNAANTLADQYVVSKYGADARSADYSGKTQAEFEAEAAEVKAQINAEAANQDKTKIDEFTRKFASIKKAERQGAIDATGASIQQETLLKQYVNRFPHLDDRFRTVYSSTRAVNEANKFGQVKDPIEEGVDAMMKEAATLNITPSELLRRKELENKAKEAEMLAKIGQNIFPTVSGIVDRAALDAGAEALRVVNEAVAQMGGDTAVVNSSELSAILDIKKQEYLSKNLHSIISRATQSASGDLNVVLPMEQYKALEKKLSDAWDISASYVKTKDSKEKIKFANEFQEEVAKSRRLGIDAIIAEDNPIMEYMINKNPNLTAALMGDANRVFVLAKNNQMGVVDSMLLNAEGGKDGKGPTDMQLAIGLRTGKKLLESMRFADTLRINSAVADGKLGELPTYNNPIVDAQMDTRSLEAAATTMTPDEQAKVAKAALQKEQKLTDEFGAHWYMHPTYAAQLKNPAFQQYADNIIDSSTLATIEYIPQQVSGKVTFDVDYRAEGNTSTPWAAGVYKDFGGPFRAPNNRNPNLTEAQSPAGTTDAAYWAVRRLNNLYWAKRTEYGAAKAAEWANGVQLQLDKKAEPNPKATGTIQRGAK